MPFAISNLTKPPGIFLNVFRIRHVWPRTGMVKSSFYVSRAISLCGSFETHQEVVTKFPHHSCTFPQSQTCKRLSQEVCWVVWFLFCLKGVVSKVLPDFTNESEGERCISLRWAGIPKHIPDVLIETSNETYVAYNADYIQLCLWPVNFVVLCYFAF